MFDRFHQASAVLTRETQGAGLGLYITKRLVEALGGTIDARSAPGQGSTFMVRMPQARLAPAGGNGDAAPLDARPQPDAASLSAPNSAISAGS